ncbi:MAG: DUF58 domain-containing protein [Gammaproteobacteria bacterium]|nr:MAG: DUF58 domain-containing protein [Gammaproteobacteria bacterium]
MRPAWLMIYTLLLLTIIAVAIACDFLIIHFWLIPAMVFLVLAIVDFLFTLLEKKPSATREIATAVAVGVWNDAGITVQNRSRRTLFAEVIDHYPHDLHVENALQKISVPAGKSLKLKYKYRSVTRGDKKFPLVDILLLSPLKLWKKRIKIECENTIKVYPCFSEISRYLLLATDNNSSQMGIVKKRKRGEGIDFHQLREYREGDSLRQIDWKATSRTKKLISREYQDERDQQVVFLIDSGQRMRSMDGDMSHFDHALNSMLLLAYIALKQGDSVGIMSFGGQESTWCPPAKGVDSVNALLNKIYHLQPKPASSDFQSAAVSLLSRVKKRSLIVVISNISIDDVDEIMPALKLLKRNHLVFLANIHENRLDDILSNKVDTFEEALCFGMAANFAEKRENIMHILSDGGVITADIIADQLAGTMVNRYLEIKGAGLL